MSDYKDKDVLVVGGSSGIGNGIAQAFSAAGAHCCVWGTRASADAYAGDEGSELLGLGYAQVDVTDGAAVTKAAAEHGPLDVLVLSQGTVRYGREEFTEEGFRAVVDLNLNSVMLCLMAFYPALVAAGGCVIIVGSTAGFRAARGNPAYSASKAALIGLNRSIAQAWVGEGIRVNAVAPGLVDTKLTKVTTAQPERLTRTLSGIPAGRLGTPADIAAAVLFLASPQASYIIGQTIIVDGGLTL